MRIGEQMRITSENLDEMIELNQKIQKEIHDHIYYIQKHVNKYKSLSHDQQAFHMLKERSLIQLPIPDSDWGGAIRNFFSGFKLPIINTAQPRVYQYFIYWHETYHITEREHPQESSRHDIYREQEMNERKADYFASQMIFLEQDLLDFYQQTEGDVFVEKIAQCMHAYRAPYKAVCIELYEIAKKHDNQALQTLIKSHFDMSLKQEEWVGIFERLLLDESLVKPTYVVDLSPIIKKIKANIEKYPDVEMYQENLRFVMDIKTKFDSIRDDLKRG